MEKAKRLLANIYRLNIRLWIEDGKLFYKAPQGKMTPELKRKLKENRAEIVAFLGQVGSVESNPNFS